MKTRKYFFMWAVSCAMVAMVAFGAQAADEAWQELLEMSAQERQARSDADERLIERAGIELGTWYCVGPFKDRALGLHYESFEVAFPPEVAVLATGKAKPDLKQTFQATQFPSMAEVTKRWIARPEWTDGYNHDLPMGPPPGWNETVYLYRTIRAAEAVSLDVEIHAEDDVRAWLNGEKLGEAFSTGVSSKFPASLRRTLNLEKGENQLLVKITTMHGARTFAFSMPLVTPSNDFHPDYMETDRNPYRNSEYLRMNKFYPNNEPYVSDGQGKRSVRTPEFYNQRDTWRQTMLASLNAMGDEFREKSRHIHKDLGIQPGTWYSIGPFKGGNSRRTGSRYRNFSTEFGPEEGVDLAAAYEEGTLRWQAQPAWENGKTVELVGHSELSTNYVYRTISAARETDLTIHLNGTYVVQVWVNGEEVHSVMNRRRFRLNDDERGADLTIPLQQGENELLVKLLNWRRTPTFYFSMLTQMGEMERLQRALWNAVARDFPEEPARSQIRWERRDKTWSGVDSLDAEAPLLANYGASILAKLKAGQNGASILEQAHEEGGLERVRSIYLQASRYADALRRLREFSFDVPVTPMYDPPTLAMQEVLDKKVPGSPGGQAYLERLESLRGPVEEALAKADRGSPDALRTVMSAAAMIDAMWEEQVRALGSIAFVRCPEYWVNAIAPYTAHGASPSDIVVFDPARPDVAPRVVYDNPKGAIFDMNVTFDGDTLLFSAKPNSGTPGGWDIFEVGVDGEGLRQITNAENDKVMGSASQKCMNSNISPAELPNGDIVFISTRAGTYVNCQSEPAGHIFAASRDGSNVRRISGNTHSDHTPQVMNDGRVLFTRWDYGVDKNVFLRQSLWVMNPDGSRLQLFSGNTIENPNAFWEARAIPGRPEVVCVFGPHHEYHAGMIGVLWNHLGYEVPRGTGFRWVTQEVPLVDDLTMGWGYQDPYPINERLFLVSYGGDGDHRNRIYLLDDRGNRKCIYEHAELGCWDPVLLREQVRPPVVVASSEHQEFAYRDPFTANQNPEFEMGAFMVQDVYEGKLGDIKRGEIKSLAIMEQLSKVAYPLGSDVWGYSPMIGRGTMFVRRMIGTVPVEEDGSAHFLAPAVKDISINALDAEGRVLKKMGSTTHVMPGETVSCIGCHENRHMAPPVSAEVPLAATRMPSVPHEPEWGTGGLVDFVRVVQPVLDEYCVECHSGPEPDGLVDLSNDKTRFFNMGYNHIVDGGLVNYANMNGTDHSETPAKGVGAIVSRIRDYIETDHSGQVLPLEARQRIYAWIDAGIPYYGTYSFTNTYTHGGRDRWYVRDDSKWYLKDFQPVFNRRCFECHRREVNRQTYNYGPRQPDQKVVVTSKLWDDQALMTAGFSSIGRMGPNHRINLTHPEWSRMLTAPLAREAGGLGLCQGADGAAYVFKDKSDPDYQAMLNALEQGRETILADPRVDMLNDWSILTAHHKVYEEE